MERLTLGPEPLVFHLGWEGGKARPGKAKHDGVLTLAIREEAPQVMLVGFTFCSPTDQFDRTEGRNKALYRMNEWPLRCRFIGEPSRTLSEVIRALCCKEFDELGHFCGEHLDAVLFSIKPVPRFMKGGGEQYVMEKVCRVPSWAKGWWYRRDGNDQKSTGKEALQVEIEEIPKRSPFGRMLTDCSSTVRDLPSGVTEEIDRIIWSIRLGGPLHV